MRAVSHHDLATAAPERIDRAVMVQRWDRLSFLHRPCDPGVVRRVLPRGLEIDTFEGAAWIGLIAFRLSVRAPGLPALPWISRFAEVNVRTLCEGRTDGAGSGSSRSTRTGWPPSRSRDAGTASPTCGARPTSSRCLVRCAMRAAVVGPDRPARSSGSRSPPPSPSPHPTSLSSSGSSPAVGGCTARHHSTCRPPASGSSPPRSSIRRGHSCGRTSSSFAKDCLQPQVCRGSAERTSRTSRPGYLRFGPKRAVGSHLGAPAGER